MSATGSLALKIQRMSSQADRVLVLSEAAAVGNGTCWFRPGEVVELFRRLRLPPPANVHEVLRRLRDGGLLTQPARQVWGVSPEGRETIRRLLGDLDHYALHDALEGAPGAEYLRALNPVIDPAFAPPRWAAGIARLHEQSPFERNVFCMTRFPEDEDELPDPIAAAVEILGEVVSDHGLVLQVASDKQVEDNLLGNVGAYMWGSMYGIGLLEDRVEGGLNYNVVAEVGSMLMTGRRCALLKDITCPPIPSDLGAEIYKRVDLDHLDTVRDEAHKWVAKDLAKGACPHCPEEGQGQEVIRQAA